MHIENENLSSSSEVLPHPRYIPAVASLSNSTMNSPVENFAQYPKNAKLICKIALEKDTNMKSYFNIKALPIAAQVNYHNLKSSACKSLSPVHDISKKADIIIRAHFQEK